METASHVVYTANAVYARASPSATSTSTSSGAPAWHKAVGLTLAIASGLFIGTSFVLKKVGLLKANARYHQEAGEGYGYLKNAWWWCGMTLMILGELCNFAAYAFVDAILVTPLGALSVVVTTILSSIFLKERLSIVGKIGCFLCILGATIIAINAPEQAAVQDIQEMQHFFIAPGFLSYAGVVILVSLFLIFWAGPRYGKTNMFVYISVCSFIGGISVTMIQGLGAAIIAQARGESQFKHWFLYFLFFFCVITLLTEIVFLNKALNIFNSSIVTPVYYVEFTSAVIISSAVLFQGFSGSVISILDIILGFLVTCSGVVLLQLAKSSKDVPDTAVFSGDLDQVRTMAEQNEPESEPRADTIRGGAAIVRALSKRRTQRLDEEVKQIHEQSLEPIGEDEMVEWDGLRRRKTVLGSSQPGSLRRAKTIHPPLGHTASFNSGTTGITADTDDDIHPGFLPRFGGRSTRKSSRSTSARRTSPSPVPMTGIHIDSSKDDGRSPSPAAPHVFGLPAMLSKDGAEDTAYHSPAAHARVGSGGAGGVHFGPDVEEHERNRAASTLAPRPPAHMHGAGKRHFSFQNVFHRHKSDAGSDISKESSSAGTKSDYRPSSRSEYSYSSVKPTSSAPGDTEEERLGLVKGDSKNQLPSYTEEPEEFEQIRPEDGSSSDDWNIASASRSSDSPVHVGRGDIGASPQGRGTSRGGYRRGASSEDSDDERYGIAKHTSLV